MDISWSKKHRFLLGIVLGTVLCISLFFALQKPITIVVDNDVVETRVLLARTVEDVLKQEEIVLGEKDKVEPLLTTPIQKNMEIVVTRAFKVVVVADGEKREILSTPVVVKDAIKLAGFEVGEKDIVKTLPTAKTVPNQEIEVIRVTEEEINIEEKLPYQTERTTDDTLEKGLSRTIKHGKNGLSKNTIMITYHNGEEVKREVVKTETIREPENKVVAMGNITSVSRSGQRLNFKEALYMEASAYTYTGNRTATGKEPRVGLVAVDPRVIPLGTQLYIEGYGYAKAADTGGSIKGNKIDLFMEERAQCVSWGRRTVKVYILE